MGERDHMLFAGAIEFSPGEVLLIVAFVAAIGLGLTTIAAMTAWGFCRRPMALLLGAVAFWGGLALAADRVDGPLALAIAWGCSAAMGIGLAALGRQRSGSGHP